MPSSLRQLAEGMQIRRFWAIACLVGFGCTGLGEGETSRASASAGAAATLSGASGSAPGSKGGGGRSLECDYAVENGIDAYSLALLGYLTDSKADSDEAIRFVMAWADNFQGFDPVSRPGAQGNSGYRPLERH